MKQRRIKVGISALFDPADTPHARTFLRAVATARNTRPALRDCDFVFLDDGAETAAAERTASRFIEAGVDVVIGHFASDAALAVADLYARHGVALLTPAATVDALTDGRSNVFRFCPNDGRIAAGIAGFAADRGWRRLSLAWDDSGHGRAIVGAFRRSAADLGLTLSAPDQGCDALVFSGRLRACRDRVSAHGRHYADLPIILTDDAVSPHFGAAGPGDPPVHAVGFRPIDAYPAAALLACQYRAFFHEEPETYFVETIAAFDVLEALLDTRSRAELLERLAADAFPTVMGDLRFDGGELPSLSTEVWTLTPTGFAPSGAAPAAGAAPPPAARPSLRMSATP